MPWYIADQDQMNVLKNVKHRLYNENIKMTADERRDLANTLDYILMKVEQTDFNPDEYELVKK